jgi:hypothetical protein
MGNPTRRLGTGSAQGDGGGGGVRVIVPLIACSRCCFHFSSLVVCLALPVLAFPPFLLPLLPRSPDPRLASPRLGHWSPNRCKQVRQANLVFFLLLFPFLIVILFCSLFSFHGSLLGRRLTGKGGYGEPPSPLSFLAPSCLVWTPCVRDALPRLNDARNGTQTQGRAAWRLCHAVLAGGEGSVSSYGS